MDLRLMHQWITATAGTMSSAQLDDVREMWSVSVPQMAFEYEPLLHTLLALGAAHRATLLPDEANNLRPVHHAYIHSALQEHRPVTANLDSTISESVCLNAVLISFYTLFLRSEPSTAPYEPPLLWLSMARGIRTVLKSVYHKLLQNNSRLCPLLLAQPTLWNQNSTFYKGPAHPFEFLLEYRQEEEVMNEETIDAYRQTIAYIERFYICSQNQEPDYVLRKTFNGFPPIVPAPVLDFIAEKRPRALAILAYHFAIAKRVEDVWWLRGIPEREVRGISSIMPPEWKWTMVWPLNLISQAPGREHEYPIPTEGQSVIETLF
ncbi:hypothetical protein N7492_001120 [Penicillium capsulatum]|uniref:Uncharacterized protein n=1 Tax=Penicillium capsulatum TaxID=69766 RepID=A0A9W9M020_9EURO|nr:hypothetical protein N7492_001120 [Penicillium capsulatum]KAJ6129823.1 hypothetical protein N7512_002603 [Penicillium capsulatum]